MKGQGESRLTDLPNIGAALAAKLETAGVATPSELKRLGSIEALRRIRASGAEEAPCRSMLSALEGAVRGVRWHDIPKPQRDALWRRYHAHPSVG